MHSYCVVNTDKETNFTCVFGPFHSTEIAQEWIDKVKAKYGILNRSDNFEIKAILTPAEL